MRRFFLLCLVTTSLCCCLSAGAFRPQRLLQIPAQPGQQISSLQVDAQGNLIVAAQVTLAGGSYPYLTSAFGLVKKIDPQGNEIFSRFLPGVNTSLPPLVLALDKNGDIYVGGQTATANAFPFTNVLYAGGGFLLKLNGADGTLAYSAELAGTPTSITIDSNGQALLTMNSIGQLPLTRGAYSNGGTRTGSPANLMYIVRLSQAGDSISCLHCTQRTR
jgi:hypothetical protein